MKKSYFSTPVIIHLFAIAHAVIAAVSHIIHYMDAVPLTVLTIAMIVIIALRHNLRTEIVAILTLAGTFIGYLVGTYGGMLVAMAIPYPALSSAITTTLFTEILGWSVYAFANLKIIQEKYRADWSPSMMQILFVVVAIMLFRVSYTLIFDSAYFSQASIFPEFQRLMKHAPALLTMLCANIFFVSFRQHKKQNIRILDTTLFIVALSALLSAVVYYNFPWGNGHHFAAIPFLRMYAVILLCNIVVYTLSKLIAYITLSETQLHDERGQKHLAQFQYNRLKMQINPHFLFNSLNILDFLVQEGEKERAGAFIRKLADCYRYMLKTEDESVVSLRDELDFAHKYSDLLSERFDQGLIIHYEIGEEALSRHVVPCCLQLLIENATKHNVVNAEKPLTVRIGTEGGMLYVSNNLQPRLSTQASTGKGLNNIRQQYLDISNKDIIIENDQKTFTVKIPLL